MPTLDDAVNAIRSGNREQGRQLLEEILETDEGNEDVWLWLSSVVDTDEDREICLENVLALNPDNVVAQRGLEALRSGTFNVHEIEEAVEETAPAPPADATFLDQFTIAGESESGAEELDLPFPGQKAKTAKTGGLNKRIIILAAVGLCIVLALAAAVAYNVILGDKGGTPAPQGQPAQNGQPTATLSPSPAPPTDTPTPTKTPLQLPTRKPTGAPTPTATPVVSPTAPVGR
jgi:hypothetical protein